MAHDGSAFRDLSNEVCVEYLYTWNDAR